MPKRKRSYARRSSLIDPDFRRQMILDQYDPAKARGSEYSKSIYGPNARLASVEQRKNRMLTGYRGSGDYRSWAKYIPRAIGALAGGASGLMSGNFLSAARGAGSGWNRGADFSKYIGWGKYHRKNYIGHGDYGGDAGGNQIMAGSVQTPMTVNASDDLTGDITISHREFVGNVTATGGSGNISAFAIVSYALNPGLVASFPWLSQIAENFSLYEPQGIIYEYKPTSGELGATGTNSLGKVVMATQYDPDAPAFTSTVQMENYDYATACKPSERMLHGVETAKCSRAPDMLYVRTGTSAKDKVFTDVGTFMIATEGLPITNGVTANVGELWVSYKIRLSRAQLFNSLLGQGVGSDLFFGSVSNSTAGNIMGSNTTAQITDLGAAAVRYTIPPTTNSFAARLSNTIGCTIIGTSSQLATITFPSNIVAGTYVLNVYAFDDNNGAWQTKFQTMVNCADVTALVNNQLNAGVDMQVPASATTTLTSTRCYITVTAPGNLVASLVLACNNTSATKRRFYVDIQQLPATTWQ